ncbi:MAG TPA: polysaccharide deacetylase family protein [Caulobacteraceae bacterium]|nr:polysaccharide deacetylase family protein [Caulobacteraceae bacterium]
MTSSPYADGRRALVIHEDDVGMTHGSNVAFRELSARGVVSSGSVMAPCPWFAETLEMAAADPSLDLGVHLTLNAEKRPVKWRPLTRPPRSAGLTDERGYFWPDPASVRRHAHPEAVEAELRAQIDAALGGGIDVTHLDAHCGAAMSREFLPIYRRLGEDYDLPVVLMRRFAGGNPRPAGQPALAPALVEAAEDAAARGEPVFDLFFETPWDRTEAAEPVYRDALAGVPEGLSFFAFHFNAPGDFETIEPEFARYRTDEYALFGSGRIEPMLAELGITLLGMRELRDKRRAVRAGARQ